MTTVTLESQHAPQTSLPPSSSLPPSYSDPSGETVSSNIFPALSADTTDDGVALPVYSGSTIQRPAQRTSRPEPKEFEFDAKKNKKTFAVLTLVAESYSKNIPTYLEGQPIKGRFKLLLDKPDAIQSVSVTLLGQLITGPNIGEQFTFVDVSQTLWTPAMGDPSTTTTTTNPSSSTTSDSPAEASTTPTTPAQKFNSKLPEGEYTWNFSLDMPKQVVVPIGPKNEPQMELFVPPQTFKERHARASIVYEVHVKVTRSNWLKTDSRILAGIGYIPLTRPPPFSPLRRLAYQEGLAIMGPSVDPEGWKVLEPVQIKGKVFNYRTVNIRCTVYLAKPLSYTRGSVIPLCMLLESEDEQAVDLLSSPQGIVLRLRRRLRCQLEKGSGGFEGNTWKDAFEHSQLAVWWPSTEVGTEPKRRMVNGELHLRPDIKPTSAVRNFKIAYSVVLFPFDTAGFESADSEPLLEEPVEVVTAYGPGPRPTMTSPPQYDTETAVMQPSRPSQHAFTGAWM